MNVNETEAHLPALMEAFNIPFTGHSFQFFSKWYSDFVDIVILKE